MKYIYKNGVSYTYKRRIPHSKKFFIFNLKTKNKKRAIHISIIFNKLSFDIFNYIKTKGKGVMYDYNEVLNALNHYRDKALEEYKDYETKRHKHLEEMFKIEEKDPLLGARYLSGADPKVIEQALTTFKNLSLANFNEQRNKRVIIKVAKKVVERSTPEIKALFKELRNNDENLFTFLSLLFKVEADVLKVDYERANQRFNPNFQSKVHENSSTNNMSFIVQSKEDNKLLSTIVYDFLFNDCGYKEEDLNNSKSQCAKTSKMCELFLDYMEDNVSNMIAKNINFFMLKSCISIIKDIPKKEGNITQKYCYYKEYKKVKDKNNYEKRSITTIKGDLKSFNRFVSYLEDKKYITLENHKELVKHINNEKKSLDQMLLKGQIKDKKERCAFKSTMLKAIFSEENPFFKYVFDLFEGKIKLRSDMTIENYEARFYIPLILFFSGARVEEMAQLKAKDFDIREYPDGIIRLLVFLEANERRGYKTYTSKRIILLHDYLVHDLDLISFIKKCQNEKREYLFNCENIGEKVGKEFNRPRVKNFCIKPYLTREDEFYNTDYVLYSFRHNYKTHMRMKGLANDLVDKLQGHKVKVEETSSPSSSRNYITYDSDEVLNVVNSFNLHEQLDFSRFKEVAKLINK